MFSESAKPISTTAKPFGLSKDADALHHLRNLRKDLKSLNVQSLDEIDEFFEKVSQSSILYEKRIQQIKVEKEALDHTMDSIWNSLHHFIGPLWKVEAGMFGIYEQVVQVYKELMLLSKESSLNTTKLAMVQEKLNEIENTFKVDGKLTLDGEKEVKGGQAVITALIEHCYRLAHHLVLKAPEVDSGLMDLKIRVEKIISDLNLMSTAPGAGLKINSQDLIKAQMELDEIDSTQKDAKFLDAFGNIPAGQAHLRDLIERAYDLVNHCQILLENEEDEPLLSDVMTDSIQKLKDKLQESSSYVFAFSKAKIGELNHQFSNTVDIIKEWLNNPQKGLNKISSKVASVQRSGMAVLTRIYAELEPVSDELLPVQAQLNTIRSSLLEIRNQFNKTSISQSPQPAQIKDFKERVESVYSELEALDQNRVDGNFVSSQVKKGQDHLRSLMNECYCLVFEMIDRCSV